MYRYQKIVLKSDIIKELEDQKKKQQNWSGTSSTKEQGVSTQDQVFNLSIVNSFLTSSPKILKLKN